MKTYEWQLNIWTGDHYCHIDDDVTLWRMAGKPPHMYWCTAFAKPGSPRTGARKTPKSAIESIRRLIKTNEVTA